jgi:hypothetical protein
MLLENLTYRAAAIAPIVGARRKQMRKGNWIQTYSGKKIYPLDPRPEEICIEDIAHALSNICRFTGHCSEFYSVAQHSVYVSVHVSKQNALWGLLHDASEAYLCDIVRPVKNSVELIGYKALEHRMQSAIGEVFGLSPVMPEEVKMYDNILLITEARDLGMLSPEWNNFGAEPLATKIYPQQPKDAERSFYDWLEVIRRTSMCEERLPGDCGNEQHILQHS